MVRLMILMKDMTGDYVAMKACVFGADEIKDVLVNLDIKFQKNCLQKLGSLFSSLECCDKGKL